ncbi:MAG: hypothetical protein JWM07_810 [Candidatus Saccharibacteria bacterium]|nr:hypothetical protein [Candidatus Saccharibacteria bacterium]
MFDIVAFIYSNAALTASLTVGFWVGIICGPLIGAYVFFKYVKWGSPHRGSFLFVRRLANDIGLCAVAIIVLGCAAIICASIGPLVLWVAWIVWLPALVVGTALSVVRYVCRRIRQRMTARANFNSVLFDPM